MTLTIRPVRPEDYEALAQLNNGSMAGAEDTAEGLQEDDHYCTAMERWVAEVDGQVAGHASWFQLPSRFHPQKFWMDGAVHAAHKGKGVGEALFQKVLGAILPKDPIQLRTFSREDYADTRRFLEKHRFVEMKRTWESFLDLAAFDFAPYAGQPESVEAQGIRLTTLAELQGAFPDWEQRLLDLYNTVQSDVPDFDTVTAVDMEQFRKSYLGAKSFRAEGQFLAVDGDRWIGMSTLWKKGDPEGFDIGLTGTRPEYRRRGIALALKLRSMAWAKAQGASRLRTTNASTNVGMLAINEKLGFAKRPAWLHMVRTF